MLSGLVASTSLANNLLQGGDFEDVGTGIPGWDLEESIFDQTTMTDRDFGNIDTAQQIGFGPNEGALDLWLRPFAGGSTAGPDNLTNAVLSQTVPVSAGNEYTFSGYTRFEINFSGGADPLDSGSPLGAVTSPTETTFELAYLNSAGNVIGSPTLLDVKADRIDQIGFPIANDDGWYQHVLTETAPAGAVSARVSAAARKMVFNVDPGQSAFFDTFSFADTSSPVTELLENPDLEDVPDEFGAQWVVTEVAGGNLPGDEVLESRGFANRPDSGGGLGVWLKAFVGDAAQPADGFITQTVPGVEGGEYSFSGWALWEQNYSGGVPSFDTETFMELAFLDGSGSEIGTPVSLDLRDTAQSNGGGWLEHIVSGTAPAGTVEVRVSAGALGMETNMDPGQSAFFDDFALTLATAGTDADNDGDVDGADFLLLQQNDPSQISQWALDYGSGSGNLLASQTIPEPTALVSALIGLALCGAKRIRQ